MKKYITVYLIITIMFFSGCKEDVQNKPELSVNESFSEYEPASETDLATTGTTAIQTETFTTDIIITTVSVTESIPETHTESISTETAEPEIIIDEDVMENELPVAEQDSITEENTIRTETEWSDDLIELPFVPAE